MWHIVRRVYLWVWMYEVPERYWILFLFFWLSHQYLLLNVELPPVPPILCWQHQDSKMLHIYIGWLSFSKAVISVSKILDRGINRMINEADLETVGVYSWVLLEIRGFFCHRLHSLSFTRTFSASVNYQISFNCTFIEFFINNINLGKHSLLFTFDFGQLWVITLAFVGARLFRLLINPVWLVMKSHCFWSFLLSLVIYYVYNADAEG